MPESTNNFFHSNLNKFVKLYTLNENDNSFCHREYIGTR